MKFLENKKTSWLIIFAIALVTVFFWYQHFLNSNLIKETLENFKNREQSEVPAQKVQNYSKNEIKIGGEILKVDLATTSADRSRGLSGRPDILDGQGMLFVFENSDQHGFWMKDMLFPIDIFWIGEDQTVVHIVNNISPETYPKIFSPSLPAKYVLETKAGFAVDKGIRIGDPVDFLSVW